ncbi:hypothetical protein [Nitrosomonas communis]|uniref:hypothetical protein n=1 Tax=Nitrosomonas communis TaxID=44574 RepID=UPI003D2DED0F
MDLVRQRDDIGFHKTQHTSSQDVFPKANALWTRSQQSGIGGQYYDTSILKVCIVGHQLQVSLFTEIYEKCIVEINQPGFKIC